MDIQCEDSREDQKQKISASQDKTNGQFLFYMRFVLVVLAIAINNTTCTSVPFIFYQSKLDCVDPKTSKTYECSYSEACELGNYKISDDQPYPQLYSITQQLNLFCDRAIYDLYIQTSSKIGRAFTYTLLIFIPIRKEIKEIFIHFQIFIIGAILLFLLWIQTIEMFIISFFFWYACFAFVFGLFYIYIEEQLPLFQQNYAIGYTNIAWTTGMIIYIIFTYFFGTWENTVIHFNALPCLLISIVSIISYFSYPNSQSLQVSRSNQSNLSIQDQKEQANQLISENPKQQDNENSPLVSQSSQQIQKYTEECKDNEYQENQQQLNEEQDIATVDDNEVNQGFFYKLFPFMYYDEIRQNFYVWAICRVTQGIIYNFPFYYLDQIKGNLFVNSLILTFAEVLASFIASVILVKLRDSLKLVSILIQFLSAIIFFTCIFFFESKEEIKKSESFQESINSLLPLILSKISYIAWVIFMAYQKQVIPIKFQQQQISITNQLNAIAITFVPAYRYLCINYSINPFIGLGILGLIGTIASFYFIEIKEEDYNFEKTPQKQKDKRLTK